MLIRVGFPGHPGVSRNENADIAAKSVVTNVDKQAIARAIPHIDMTRIIKVAVRKECQRYWSSPEHLRNKLREIKPDIEVWKSSFNNSKRTERLTAVLLKNKTKMTFHHESDSRYYKKNHKSVVFQAFIFNRIPIPSRVSYLEGNTSVYPQLPIIFFYNTDARIGHTRFLLTLM